MSLPAPYSEVYLEGDGVTTEFAFGTNFKPISAGLVKCIVYLEDGYAVVPTYTVNMAVGSITISALTKPDNTILTAPPLGSTVRIFRDEPEAQPVSASQIQSYTSKQLEILFDAIVAMIQEVSYTVDHKTVRLTEPQRDISLQKLTDLVDGHLIYWDAIKRELVATNYPQQDVVQCVSGLFFKIETDPNTHNPYLEWSTDNSDWHAINVDAARALAQDAYTLADDAYNLASTTRGELNAHKADHANPHETSMTNLIDTDFNNLVSGQFLQFDGIKWKNVNYTAVYAWGGIGGNIDDQTDLKAALDGKVEKAGDTMSGALNIADIASSNTPLLTLTHSSTATYKWNMAPRYNSTTLSVYPGSTETNGFRFATTGFVPASNNARYLGSASLKWKGVYTGALNNGADLVVPNKAGTLATMGDVELAARSGTQLTEQGVWYAKMYAATVAPAAENGTNYADFSQVDGQGNPIIVTYNRVNGAWVQDQTITPPAEYDGYVIVTSKIWDIAEQTGQQGGRVLWNHTSKEFTPYPQIISLEDINVTGNSTVDMPQNPGANQIVNKDYVDEAIASIPTPTVDVTQSIDAEIIGGVVVNGSEVSNLGTGGGRGHLILPGSFNLDATTFEVGVAFTTSNQSGNIGVIKGVCTNDGSVKYPTGVSMGMTSVGDFIAVVYTDINDPLAPTIMISGGTAVSSTKYYLKLVYDHNDASTPYKLSVSTDGTTYTVIGQSSTNVPPSNPTQYTIGQTGEKLTSVDMSGCYIKRNGIIIWQGMDAPGLPQRAAKGHEVIEFQAPTAANSYTWYRKYADGWVEQGGKGTSGNGDAPLVVVLPVEMSDTNYNIQVTGADGVGGGSYLTACYYNQTTTGFRCYSTSGGSWYANTMCWKVAGMAA